MLKPIRSTFQRRPAKRQVTRTFRVPPATDKAIEKVCRERDVSKSTLIREILEGWLIYHKALEKIASVGVVPPEIERAMKGDCE